MHIILFHCFTASHNTLYPVANTLLAKFVLANNHGVSRIISQIIANGSLMNNNIFLSFSDFHFLAESLLQIFKNDSASLRRLPSQRLHLHMRTFLCIWDNFAVNSDVTGS